MRPGRAPPARARPSRTLIFAKGENANESLPEPFDDKPATHSVGNNPSVKNQRFLPAPFTQGSLFFSAIYAPMRVERRIFWYKTFLSSSTDYRYALTHIDVIEKGDSIHIFLPKSSKYFNSYRINTVWNPIKKPPVLWWTHCTGGRLKFDWSHKELTFWTAVFCWHMPITSV